MFGREPQPYQKAYDLHGMEIKETKDGIIVKCTRCNKVADPNKQYKIHSDGAITFSFRCMRCHWSYDIYRNEYAEYKQVKRALLN